MNVLFGGKETLLGVQTGRGTDMHDLRARLLQKAGIVGPERQSMCFAHPFGAGRPMIAYPYQAYIGPVGEDLQVFVAHPPASDQSHTYPLLHHFVPFLSHGK
jgi:hypothetical protein